MCIIAYLILGMIAGWFVASQGVGNSGASDFRAPPPPMFRPPYYNQPHPQRSPCPRARRYIPRSVSPEIVEPVRGPSRVDRRSRDRTVSAPPLNRPGIVPPVRQRIAASMARHICRWALSSRPSPSRAAPSIILANPEVVNAVPRPLTKTKRDGLLSHCRPATRSSSSAMDACLERRSWRGVEQW